MYQKGLWKLLQKSSQKLWSRQHWPKGTMFCPNAPSPSSSHISFGCWPRSRQADGYMPYCFFFAVTGHLKYFCYICAVFTQLSSQHFQITTHFLVLLFSWLVNQTIFWCCCFLARLFFFFSQNHVSLYSPIPEIRLQFWMLKTCETSWMISGVRTNCANCASLEDFRQLPAWLQCCILWQMFVLLLVSY